MQTEGLLGGNPAGMAPNPTGMGLRDGGPQSRVGVAELLEQVLTLGASDLHLTAGARRRSGSTASSASWRTTRCSSRPRSGDDLRDPHPEAAGEVRGASSSSTSPTRCRARPGSASTSTSSATRSAPPSGSSRSRSSRSRTSAPAVGGELRRACPGASCSSPARPARASRRRWPRWSTSSTATEADHIMTVEDPIEFLHQPQDAAWSTSARSARTPTPSPNALKHVLRQDPDVILVGEMRDLETISIALTAAETGHLVFATLHTQDAPQTIDRIIDVFPPHQQQQVRVQLAGALQGVVCQQLVPDRRRARAGSSRPRCWWPRRPSAT